jgi:hypothetical protein
VENLKIQKQGTFEMKFLQNLPAASEKKENPWNNASNANPGEEWQPEAWSPSSKR